MGERLTQFRLRAQLTQKQVADVVGIGKNGYRGWESGDSDALPSLIDLPRLAEAYGVDVRELASTLFSEPSIPIGEVSVPKPTTLPLGLPGRSRRPPREIAAEHLGKAWEEMPPADRDFLSGIAELGERYRQRVREEFVSPQDTSQPLSD